MLIQSKSFGNKTSIICSFHRAKYNYEKHIHQFSEMVYMLSGEMNITVDGITETAKEGDIIVIPPLSVHSYSSSTYNEHWMCSFSNDFVLDIVSENDLYSKRRNCVFKPSPGLKSYIETRLIDAEEHPMDLTPNLTSFFKATLHSIFEEYIRLVTEIEIVRTNSHVISEIVKYISEHFTENITLNSIGKALGYSPKYISNCISNIEGMNFCYLLNSFRIEKARKLLKKNELSITTIAFECGFSSERSFRRAFAKITNKSPTEYKTKK